MESDHRRRLLGRRSNNKRGNRPQQAAYRPRIEVLESRMLLSAEFDGPLSGWLNVTAAPYNAVANGTTDDTAAIQAALNNANQGNGTTPSYSPVVYLPAGTYKISSTLTFLVNECLRGDGQVITTLNYTGTSLVEMLKDLPTSGTWSMTYTNVNLPAVTGGSTAYIGFGGGTGGSTATQTISNFTFGSLSQSYANALTTSASSSFISATIYPFALCGRMKSSTACAQPLSWLLAAT